MPQHNVDVAGVQTFVFWGSIIGLALLLIPLGAVIGGASHEPAGEVLRSALWLACISWPFALGLLSRWYPKDLRKRRWLWLLCFAGVPVPSIFLHGFGIYLTATALVYLWAFFATRSAVGNDTR